ATLLPRRRGAVLLTWRWCAAFLPRCGSLLARWRRGPLDARLRAFVLLGPLILRRRLTLRLALSLRRGPFGGRLYAPLLDRHWMSLCGRAHFARRTLPLAALALKIGSRARVAVPLLGRALRVAHARGRVCGIGDAALHAAIAFAFGSRRTCDRAGVAFGSVTGHAAPIGRE